MKMEYRFATEQDLDLLAEWNHQLIQDEGHRNPMAVPELRERMRNWIAAEYKAVVFLADNAPVAYGLYRETEEEVYLRQLFVRRDRRRSGIGRQAMVLISATYLAAAKASHSRCSMQELDGNSILEGRRIQ